MGRGDVDPSEALLRPSEELLALCDCNNFFVSCERLFRPDLAERPVVVLSSNDGVVISRSNEVKAMGVQMGEPYFKVASLLARRGVTVFSSNFGLYEDVSRRVMAVLQRLSPLSETYSIDEAFLEVPSGEGEPWGRMVRETVLRETGIPLSVGIAPAKVQAKLASERAKRTADGVLAAPRGRALADFLGAFPVREVWGVGRQMEKGLKRYGISTALDLRNARDDLVERRFGITGLRLVWELRGVRCFPLEERETARKSIQASRTFSTPVRDVQSLCEAVTEFAVIAGRRLRAQGELAGSLTVTLTSGRFRDAWCRRSDRRLVHPATDSDLRLIRAATESARCLYEDGADYGKAEVTLSDLSSAREKQLTLFEPSLDRGSTLSRVADRLNAETGRKFLQPAILMGEKAWRPRKDMCSSVRLEELEFLPMVGWQGE